MSGLFSNVFIINLYLLLCHDCENFEHDYLMNYVLEMFLNMIFDFYELSYFRSMVELEFINHDLYDNWFKEYSSVIKRSYFEWKIILKTCSDC